MRICVLLLLLAAGLPGAAGAADMARPDGAALYAAHCTHCHDGTVSKAPHRDILGLLTARAILDTLDHGVMRQQAAALDGASRQAIAEFITGQPVTAGNDALAALACGAGAPAFDVSAPPRVSGWGVTPENTHFYPREITTIDRHNVPRLRLKWVFPFPGATRARSQPVLAGGWLFVGTHDGGVLALDRDTGCVHWSFKASAEVRTGMVIDVWQAGDRAARPRLYFGDLTGSVYAVDARAGTLVWRDRPDDHHSLTITAAPVRFGDTLLVGMSALEVTAAANPAYPCCTFRGGVVAYDAATGKRRWLTRTIDEAPRQVSVNNIGTPRLAPSGAPVWAGLTIDAKRRRVYVGTGENFSSPANDRSDSIIAMGLDDGRIAWTFQATAGDAWNMGCEASNKTNCPPESGPDYDFAAAPILATGADGRQLLLAGQKSGTVHALDPDTGKPVWQSRLGRGGIQGGVHFGMSVEGGTLFVPISDFYGGPRWPGEARPGLYALDIASGRQLWAYPAPNPCAGKPHCDPGISAAISGVTGVVFAGSMDGFLRAHDAADGRLLWEFDTAREFKALGGMTARGGSIGGGAATVFDGPDMFVETGYGIYNHMPGAALMAFTVDE